MFEASRRRQSASSVLTGRMSWNSESHRDGLPPSDWIMNYLVVNNPQRHRFETIVDGHVAVLNYNQEGKCFTFIHTEVPQELARRGVGSALAKAGLKYAREHGLQVIPKCQFVASYIERHSEFASLLSSGS